MRKVKKILTYVIAVILALLLTAYILVTTISSTIMSKSYILSKFEDTKYYSRLYELAESNFEKYVQQSGLEEDVVKDIVTQEKIEKDTKQILVNLFDGTNEEISTEEIKENLKVNINKSIHGRELTKDEEKAVDKFIEKVCDEYKSTILNTKYENTIYNYYSKLDKALNLANKVSIVVIGILAIVLIILNIRRIYRFVNGLGIAALASGCLLAIMNIYINLKVKIQNITFMNDVFSDALRKILSDIIAKIGIYGWLLVLSGIILIVVSNLAHNIKKYGTKRKYKKGHHSSSEYDDYETE